MNQRKKRTFPFLYAQCIGTTWKIRCCSSCCFVCLSLLPGGENSKMNVRILFFVSHHMLCLQPFPSLQGISIRSFYSSRSHRFILVLDSKCISHSALGCPQTLQNEEVETSCFARQAPGPPPCLMLVFLISALLVSLQWISASLSHWVTWAYVVKYV